VLRPAGSAQDRLRAELLPGERILWMGQPEPAVLFSRIDRFLAPFSIIWAGIAFATLAQALARPSENSLGLPFSIVASIVGLYLVAGRFFYKAWLKKRTVCAVTDKRVLVLRETRVRSLESAFIEQIPVIHKWVRQDGIGTIQFGNARFLDAAYGSTGLELLGRIRSNTVPVFSDIRDAANVCRLVEERRGSN